MADVRVQTPGPGQKNPEIVRNGRFPLQQVFERGKPALAGMRSLDRLVAQLHLIAEQDEVMRAGAMATRFATETWPASSTNR